jgi:predicted glutamine amidotransferase
VAHVRNRTVGTPALENTHPFKRVLWGRDWVFAHSGTLPKVKGKPLREFTPVGDTDSEHAFCWLLAELHAAFPAGYPQEQPSDLWHRIAEGSLPRRDTLRALRTTCCALAREHAAHESRDSSKREIDLQAH